MTKQEAIIAMQQGKKVTHRFFTSDEYVFIPDMKNPLRYQFEDGVKCNQHEFWEIRDGSSWEIDWEIFND